MVFLKSMLGSPYFGKLPHDGAAPVLVYIKIPRKDVAGVRGAFRRNASSP